MTGNIFIVHNQTWSCSNEASLSVFSEPSFGENNEVISIKETKVLNVSHIFNSSESLKQGDKCQLVMLSDDKKIKQGFNGEVKIVMELKTIINILSKNDNISEILSNITFKN
jgi:hypothetical protein